MPEKYFLQNTGGIEFIALTIFIGLIFYIWVNSYECVMESRYLNFLFCVIDTIESPNFFVTGRTNHENHLLFRYRYRPSRIY